MMEKRSRGSAMAAAGSRAGTGTGTGTGAGAGAGAKTGISSTARAGSSSGGGGVKAMGSAGMGSSRAGSAGAGAGTLTGAGTGATAGGLPKKCNNPMLKDSLKLHSEARLANVRGYLVNENRTVAAVPENRVIKGSPIKANGKRELAIGRGLKHLAKMNATKINKVSAEKSKDRTTTQSLRFDDCNDASSSKRSSLSVPQPSSLQSANPRDLKRAGYIVSKSGNVKRRVPQGHEEETQRFVGFVDTSSSISARQILKNKLGLGNKSNPSDTTTTHQKAGSSVGSGGLGVKFATRSLPDRRIMQKSKSEKSNAIASVSSAPTSNGIMKDYEGISVINPFKSQSSSSNSIAVSCNPTRTVATETQLTEVTDGQPPHDGFYSPVEKSLKSALPGFQPTAIDDHCDIFSNDNDTLSSRNNDGNSYNIIDGGKSHLDMIIADLKSTKPDTTSSNLPLNAESTAPLTVQNKIVRPGDVSNNYVRTNLKKKGLFRQKGGKNKASKLLKERSRELRKAHSDSDSLDMMNVNNPSNNGDDSNLVADKNVSDSNNATSFGGLSAIGLDPLQLTLDALKKKMEKAATSTSKADAKADAGVKVCGTQVTSSTVPTAASASGQIPAPSKFLSDLRLKFGNRYTPARGTQPASALFGKQAKTRRSSGPKIVQCSDEIIEASENAPPLCSGHHMPAKLLTVKKAGGNKGRKFFGCSFPSEQRCKFFLWVEDNPNVIDIVASSNERKSVSSSVAGNGNTTIEPECPIECWIRFALENYKLKLEDFDVMELKAEILLCNHRVQLARQFHYHQYVMQVAPQGGQSHMTLAGRRGDLMDKVLQSAFSQLCISCGISVEGDSTSVVECTTAKKRTALKKRKHVRSDISSDEGTGDDSERSEGESTGDEVGDDDVDEEVEEEEDEEDEEDEDYSGKGGNEEVINIELDVKSNAIVGSNNEDVKVGSSATTDMMELSSDSDDSVESLANDMVEDDDSYGSASSCGEEDLFCEDDVEEENVTVDEPQQSHQSAMVDVPVYQKDFNVLEEEEEINKVLRCTFGHENLRPGQLWAVRRVLNRKRSLLVLPTGAGKSLTYLLPSVLMNRNCFGGLGCEKSDSSETLHGSLTLVVSPLVSLMQDQLRKLPVELPGGCFSGGLTSVEAAVLTEEVLKGYIKVLFVSPERLCMPSFRQLMKTLQNERRWRQVDGKLIQSGGVGLLCIDEAHCLSQWSFNFRPSFLRIKKELEFIQPEAVLALTATAPQHVQRDIMDHLSIQEEGVLSFPPRRPNLMLHAIIVNDDEERREQVVDEILGKHDETSVQRETRNVDETNEDEEDSGGVFDYILSKLVDNKRRKVSRNGPPIDCVRNTQKAYALLPTIVYVWRRDEAESLSDYLKSQDVSAAAYHAGMERSQRSRVQLMFNKGTINVVVATVAFGMGIDKSNVRRVIHASLPKSVENYVQEVGRAGRDGDPAKCTLLLSKQDVIRQHSLSYSHTLGALQIVSLFRRLFIPKTDSLCTTQGESIEFLSEVAISLQQSEQEGDISEAMTETLLSVLELSPFKLCSVEGVRYNVLKGRIQSNPAASLSKLSKHSLFPKIVREICRLNTLPAPESVGDPRLFLPEADESGDLVSDGHGASYIGEKGRDFALAYSGGLEFELSLIDLAQAVNIRPDKLSGMLWGMQCQGILSYNLSGSAIFVTVNADGRNIVGDKSSQCTCLECWLLKLAQQVQTHVTKISGEASDRILDIWRMGGVIESKELSQYRNRKQELLMDFLCHYMDSMASSTSLSADENNINDETNQDDKTDMILTGDAPRQTDSLTKQGLAVLVENFHAMELPLVKNYVTSKDRSIHVNNADTPSRLAKISSRLQQCQRHCLVLSQDPNLVSVVNAMYTAARTPACSSSSIDATPSTSCLVSRPRDEAMKHAKREYFSLVITKILHGLGSALLPAADWRERCAAHWESCRDLSFTVVHTCALETIPP